MFNLVTISIAVALIAIFSVSGYYYGGSALNNGKTTSEAARYRNEASQISSAVTLYRAKGNVIAEGFTLQTLVDGGFLSSLPKEWEPGSDMIIRVLDKDDTASEEICFLANKQSLFTFSSSEDNVQEYSLDKSMGIPQCDKEGLNSRVPCCVAP